MTRCPVQFLKTIKRSGLGVAAFHGLRYNDDGIERAGAGGLWTGEGYN